MSQIPAGWVKKMVGGLETYEPPKKKGAILSELKPLTKPDWKGMKKWMDSLFVANAPNNTAATMLDEISGVKTFVVNVEPMGAPRMTKRDKWKKRPVVLRYFAYRDAIRAAVGPVKEVPDRVDCEFYFPMPKSWSKKKMAQMNGKPHRSKPDRDNCDKAVCDALFAEDSSIHEGSQIKRWCYAGQERVVIKLTTYKK